ncbi:MAG TPA: hypothetical protein VM012_12975, partial [Flavitalea sp.]|nr:hypothetical protein [Flavitalea sp.]
MKLQQFSRWVFCAMILFTFNSCLKDTCRQTYKIYIPVFKTLTEARADMKSGASREIENPGKIFTIGKYIFVNEINRGIHIIDNTDPMHPVNKSFINIPGNADLAVHNTTLYADSYSDLVSFDISLAENITAKNFVSN